MKKFFILALIAAFLCSCATMKAPVISNPEKVSSVNSAYVVNTNASSQLMQSTIQRTLTQIGISTYSGRLNNEYSNAEVYIKSNDEWYWDMVTYLQNFNISVYDTGTNKLIASIRYENSGFFHDYPNAEEKIREAIKLIFQNKES